MSTTKKQIGMTILRQNNSNNESIDSNNNKNANTSSCNSINNIIIRKNVYLANMPTSKSLISSSSNSNNNRNNKNDLMVKNNNNNNNNNSAYLTTRRCLNKKSQLNINSNSKNSLNNELENNYNNKNINSYINKLSLAINNKQIHKIEEEKQKQKNNFSNQHFNSFNLEKSKLESRNNININNNKNPIVSVLNNSNISTSRKVSKASVENYLKPFYLNEFSKCEKENTTLIKTKKSSIKELKISNITNIQASLERYETNQQNQQQQDTHQLDTPIIYLNSSLNTNFSLNRHINNNNNSKDLILNNNDKLKKNEKFNRPASINSLDNIKSNKNDSIASFDKLKFNEINHNHNNNNQSSQQNMLSSQTNIVNASTNSFRLTQSHKEKNSKSYTLKSNKSLASSSSSSQNLISSLNQNQINKFINNNSIQSSLIQPSQQQLPQTSKKSAFTSMKQNNLTCTTPNKSSKQQIISNQEYEGGLVEKMASFIDELKDFIDDRLIDTTSQLELANQRISGLYFNLNYLTSELINLKKQNEELKKEVVFKNNNNNNTNRSFLKDHQYLDQYSDYAKKIHTKTTERYIDSSCMKIPDSSSNLESTMNNSTSKTSSPETTSASSTSTSTSLIISQTPLESLYIKKANTPPNAFHHHHHHHNHHHKQQQQKQQHNENQPKTSKDFKSGKHFEILNDLELKRREKNANNNSSKIQSSSSSINSINFYDNMSIVNRFEINWPTRSNNETTSNDYPHRTSSPSQIDLNNLMQTQYASTDFDHDDIYENNDKNYDIMATSQSQHSPDLLQHANESLNFEANSSFSNVNTNKNDENISLAPEKDSANDILLNQNSNLVHHLHASIVPYNNLIADFDTQYIWDYESNGLVNKYSEKSDNIKFQN